MPPCALFPRRLSWRVLLCAAWLLASEHSRAADTGKPPGVREAERDGTGRVWGIEPSNNLYVLDDGENWQRVTPPGIAAGTHPVCLGRRNDGMVVCVWRVDDTHYRCSEHRGQESRALAPFTLAARQFVRRIRLAGDSRGNLWLTQTGPDIYRLKADGTAELMHRVAPEECIPRTYRGDAWDLVSMLEEPGGRLWFWSDRAGSAGSGTAIRGALLCDGEKFVQHDIPHPERSEQASLTALARKDASHLWVGLDGWGLYTLDTGTFQVERVPDQPAEASFTTLAARAGEGPWFFVMGQSRPEGAATLWRLDAAQHWEKLIDGVDERFDYAGQEGRVWAETPDGVFLGSNANGLWFVPGDGSAPRQLNWRQGFSVASPRCFFSLPGGRWVSVGLTGLTWVGEPGALLAAKTLPDDPRIRVLRVHQALRADARGRLWSVFSHNSSVLHEWDGERWTEHPFPPEVGDQSGMVLLDFDALGRPWLRTPYKPDRTAIYDPAADRWQVFGSFQEALVAQGGRHEAEFAATDHPRDLPRFGPEGRICYLSSQGQLMVFDGKAWRQWKPAEVTGGKNAGFDGAPFFNRAGRVSVNSAKQTLELVDGAGWRAAGFEEGFADLRGFFRGSDKVMPPEPNRRLAPESAARDNQGTWWLVRQRVLYKYRNGRCVPALAPGEPSPFIDGRRLGSAFVDARGNAFLRNDEINSEEYIILGPSGPLPRTTATPEPIPGGVPALAALDMRVVRLTTDAPAVDGKVRFGWRLDGGPWTALAVDDPATSLTLEGLPSGGHRFEARSFDAALQSDATPAVLNFEVNVDPVAQIAGYIAQLADPDDLRREAAVAALARQPERAGPALEAARGEAVGESQRWWIDEALEQIERTRHGAARRDRETGSDDAE